MKLSEISFFTALMMTENFIIITVSENNTYNAHIIDSEV